MLSVQEKREVSTQNVGQTKKFTIKANGKAFKILIDGLYSDKIRAVIRELWTNAYDAHKMAGKSDIPFECHLPTTYEPTFSVRDYGIGMSHDQIMGLYTNVFESSKDQDNDQVGKFGLGSKSPFAYIDTFTVTAWDGETKRLYSVFIDGDSIPEIAVMGVEPSSAERGIEISFPVKSNDIYAFRNAAQTTIVGFDTKPKIKGTPLPAVDYTPISKGTGWLLLKNQGGLSSHAVARQGCVLYPIDGYALPNLTYSEKQLLSLPMIIDFAIGELEINASREALAYDETTKANITKRIKSVAAEFIQKYQDEINQCKNMRLANRKLNALTRATTSSTLSALLTEKLLFKGRRIVSGVSIADLTHHKNDLPYDDGGVRITLFSHHHLQKGMGYGKKNSLKWDPVTYGTVRFDECVVVIDDTDNPVTNYHLRLRHWYDTAYSSGISMTAPQKMLVWIKGSLKKSGVARTLVEMSRPEQVVYLKDMPKPPNVSNSGRTKTRMKAMGLSDWVDTDVIEEDINIYVKMTRGVINKPEGVHSTFSATFRDVIEIKQALVELKIIEPDANIIGVPKTHERIVERNSDTWLNLWDLVDAAIKDNFDGKKAAHARAYKESINDVSVPGLDLMRFLVRTPPVGFKGFEYPGPASDFMKAYKTAWTSATDAAKYDHAMTLALIMKGPSAIVTVPPVSLDAESKAFLKAYPLLVPHTDRYVAIKQEMIKPVIKYINLLDADALAQQSSLKKSA